MPPLAESINASRPGPAPFFPLFVFYTLRTTTLPIE